jgi:hypothetical protein
MELESLTNHATRQKLREPKEKSRAARGKRRVFQKVEFTHDCCDGACEVIWKPHPSLQSGQKAQAQ